MKHQVCYKNSYSLSLFFGNLYLTYEVPASGLSAHDIQTVTRLYPPIPKRLPELRAYESHRFDIAAGEQVDFVINPTISRDYTIQTFGQMDTVMVLFEMREGSPEYLDGDDDSGLDYNAKIIFRLHRGVSILSGLVCTTL